MRRTRSRTRSTTSTRSSMSASCWMREPTRTKARTSRTRCAGAEAPTSCGCWQNTAVTSTDSAARPGAATSRSGRRTSTPSFAGVTTPLPSVFDVDAQEVVIMAALEGDLDVVLETAGPGVRGVVGGSPEGPLLGHAAWVGNADVVRRLLEAGADPNDHAQAEYASPLAIAAHGSGYPGNRGDHIAVAELLVAAGNTVEPGSSRSRAASCTAPPCVLASERPSHPDERGSANRS